jgi:hypothetical protein
LIEVKTFVDLWVGSIGEHSEKAEDFVAHESGEGFAVAGDVARASGRRDGGFGVGLIVRIFERLPFVEQAGVGDA